MWRSSILAQIGVLLLISQWTFAEDARSLKISELKISLETAGEETQDFQGVYPKSVLSDVLLGHRQELKMSFKVSLGSSTQGFAPQQCFVMLKSRTEDVSAYFVAENKAGTYESTVDVKEMKKRIGALDGLFDVSIVVGDVNVLGGLMWKIGSVNVEYPPLTDGTQARKPPLPIYMHPSKAKTEIEHMHTPPVARPSSVISTVFTALSVVPLLCLLAGLGRMDINFKAFPKGVNSLWAILFHCSIGAFLVLYVLFWVRLNLMQTLPIILGLGLVSVVTGHRALSAVAAASAKDKEE